MATRTYKIKGKYTDGTDYTAGTFTVSDGTNGTNGTNGKDALVYKTVLNAVAGAPVVGATLNLVEGNFNRTPVAGETIMVIYKATAAGNRTFIVLADMINTSSATITSFVETTGKTGAAGADGTNGTNGKDGADGVGFYYTTDATTGTTDISTLLSNIMPTGVKVGDFLVNAQGKVAQVTTINGNTVTAGYRTSIKGATGATGSPGATGKGIASVQVVEV